MADEIRQAEGLTDEEKQLLFGWGENIFGVAALKLSWRPKDLHFLLYADGEPLSHVASSSMRLASMESRPRSGEWAGSLLYRERRRKD